jgi:phage FluMu protein Com
MSKTKRSGINTKSTGSSDDKMIEARCNRDRSLLFLASVRSQGAVEIKCPRCRTLRVIKLPPVAMTSRTV